MRQRFSTVSVPALLIVLLAGCASVRDGRQVGERPDQRMVQAPSVAGVAEETFGKPAWGTRGDFTLSGQRVRYERGADRLALFEPLAASVKTPLRFSWAGPAGDSASVCEGWTPEQSANGRLADSRPWVLSCKWGSAPAAMLQIGEGQMRRGKLSREGAYRRGELTLGLRSAHLYEGNAQPRTAAVGYEMLHQGTVVGSLDLSGSVPRLRRPDPATPLGRAVTEAALALALVWEPASR
ncbi:MAG: hypothetical protein ACT6S0_10260 [Roseateles sp.]|uniref:hypothetical protein n=1 Tax=Roseateles sp. TaxID=1971397 RepID=UPI004035A1A2